VANPIDPDEVFAAQHRDGALPLHIGILGGATERKGFDMMPEVIRNLDDLQVMWKLHVFLEPLDENRDVWKELAEFPPSLVEPAGKRADVSEVYADLDIVFCPSRAESFCRVAAEAMMNGLPVVGSDIEPLVALLGEDEAGLVFPSGNVAAAAAALRKLVADPELRSSLGAAGKRRADRFRPEVITQELIRLYGIPEGG
jgi:glycosyltransferase involved in cell wall biosynthesis